MPSVRTYVGWLAFEHVGVPNYGRFFQKIRELLSADGVALIYSIGRINGPGHHECARKYIFPGGHTACHRARGPVSHPLEILRLHYAEPLRHWRERFLACHRHEGRIYDERFCRMWEFYLASSECGFCYGDLMVFQAQLARRLVSHRECAPPHLGEKGSLSALDSGLHVRARTGMARLSETGTASLASTRKTK